MIRIVTSSVNFSWSSGLISSLNVPPSSTVGFAIFTWRLESSLLNGFFWPGWD